ncbi:AAA family ATPase [Cellulosilyticum sp. WCF-2]|uniref:AAA family ATPase n=1 Tax=Cellulosilyticum sp. WCF-2 TaxID=2497860 RepID=UPI000F8F4188|nr:ATP-binding protein [Cellulosilyticum sp. WCF-2]QEH69139.1 ATP-binding protein [Cellulosilyticum sp. WCF-2]
MYNEILKIIEGGINRDRNKVLSYSKLLVDNLKKDGEDKFANKIVDIINKKDVTPMYLDDFLVTPIDQETKMNIADIIMPNQEINLVLPSYLENIIEEFILSIKQRDKLNKIGVDSTTSLLLYGIPGTGKTSIAHLISYKTKLPLVIVRLDALVSSLLGNTAKNIRKVFEYANNRPCILFLDEFDAIAKARDDKKELGELKRVINSLLQNIDEFNKNNVLIAATNHHELLDAAIWRRFSMTVEVLPPDLQQTSVLIKQYLDSVEYDFRDNQKKLELSSEALLGLAAADVKSICMNTIKKTILREEDKVLYNNFIYEIYLYRKHSLKDIEDAVKFLHKYGVQQRSIFKLVGIPLRSVKTILEK